MKDWSRKERARKMGTGKYMTEEAMRYQRSRSEGYELSSQNRAEVRGYNPTCNICTYSRNPYRSLRDLGVFEIAAQSVIQLLVPASVERPIAHVMTASRQGCHVGKKIPTAPATDCDMIQIMHCIFAGRGISHARKCNYLHRYVAGGRNQQEIWFEVLVITKLGNYIMQSANKIEPSWVVSSSIG